MKRELKFASIEEAVAILGPRYLEDRLLAVEQLGYVLTEYSHDEIAFFVRSARESVCRALVAMGRRRTRGPRRAQASAT